MEEKVAFEVILFGDKNEIMVNDVDSCVDRIVLLPKIQPHLLEKAVRLSVTYCQIADFRQKILEKSNECPLLIYQLFKRGIFVFKEIKPFLRNRDTFMLCYYFRKEIDDFGSLILCKYMPYGFDQSISNNEDIIDQFIE